MRIALSRIVTTALAGVLTVGVLGACSGDEDAIDDPPAPPEETTTTPDPAALPPLDLASLQALFDPDFEEVGMVVTRASVSPLNAGEHLALYIEPVEGTDASAEAYADRLMPALAAVLPMVFETYPGLATFDLCQEPPPAVDDSPTPPSETLVLLTKDQVLSVDDWSTMSIAELLTVAASDDGAGTVRASEAVAATPQWQSAVATAAIDD